MLVALVVWVVFVVWLCGCLSVCMVLLSLPSSLASSSPWSS